MSEKLDKVKIILIEDDNFQTQLLTQQITSIIGSPNIFPATNGRDAIDLILRKALYDALVLLDLNMPIMDGIAFITLLKDTPFRGAILLTSGAEERIQKATVKMAESYGISVLGHLKKPIDNLQLKNFIEKFSNFTKIRAESPETNIYDASRLKKALETKEIFNEYQPQVNVNTGELTGLECLVRWEHPSDGLVMPDAFIAIAEENDLIKRLFHHVLKAAFEDWMLIKESDLDISLALNISMENLTSTNFINFIESELKKAKIPPEKLILEVTESQLMREYSLVLNILTSLRLRNVNISIDDFGTGHSSIVQLRDIPFNELKLDKSFIHNAHNDKTLQGIFKGSIELANNLDIITKAEGVETIKDFFFLVNSGCNIAQGYFIGKPMPIQDLKQWSIAWKERFLSLKQ